MSEKAQERCGHHTVRWYAQARHYQCDACGAIGEDPEDFEDQPALTPAPSEEAKGERCEECGHRLIAPLGPCTEGAKCGLCYDRPCTPATSEEPKGERCGAMSLYGTAEAPTERIRCEYSAGHDSEHFAAIGGFEYRWTQAIPAPPAAREERCEICERAPGYCSAHQTPAPTEQPREERVSEERWPNESAWRFGKLAAIARRYLDGDPQPANHHNIGEMLDLIDEQAGELAVLRAEREGK